MRPRDAAVRLGRPTNLRTGKAWPEARARMAGAAWMLGAALLLALAAMVAPVASAASGVELILGKSRPPSAASSQEPSAPGAAAAGEGMAAEGQAGDAAAPNSTKPALTGVPQLDYVHDPNLPRELNGYNLSAYPFYDRVPEDMQFSCDGLHDGFYASVQHKCQVYHHCLFGTRYDFLCANYTAFDQKTFICHFVSEVDCENSPKYFNRNEALYKATTTTTVAPPRPAGGGGRRGGGRGGGGGERRRPAGGGGGRSRPYYSDYQDQDYDEEYDDYAEEGRGGGGKRAQGGQEAPLPASPPRAVFERPRVAPKVRRPVPLSERDKYEYSGATAAPVPAPASSPTTAPEAARPAPDNERERGGISKGASGGGNNAGGLSGNTGSREDEGFARARPESPPTSRDRQDPYTSNGRRPMESVGYGRHRERPETYRPMQSYGRGRRPYRRRPSTEEDEDYYYYYDGEDEEEDYRPRRPAARRQRPRPRRPPPRYRDDYEDEYEDEEEDAYARPVPAARPAYVTAPGGGRRARPRAPPPRRPNRHGSRYADPEDDYYYDDEEETEVARPAAGAQRRRGRPTAPTAPAAPPAPAPAPASARRNRYPEDELEEPSGPSGPSGPSAPASIPTAAATSRRGPQTLARPSKIAGGAPPPTAAPPPPAPTSGASALRGKLVEVRRHPLRQPTAAPTAAAPQESEEEEEQQRPLPPRSRSESRQQTHSGADLDPEPQPHWSAALPDPDQRLRHDPRPPTKGDYESEPDSWSRFEARVRDDPVDWLRTRESAVDAESRPRFEPRNPFGGGGRGDAQDSDARGAPLAPTDDDLRSEPRTKFSSRAEYDMRPAKLPSRTLASEVKFSNGRGGPTTEEPQQEPQPEEPQRQRFEPRAPSKYSPRPATPPPPSAPDSRQGEQDAKAIRPGSSAEEPLIPPPSTPSQSERFAGKFLSRTAPTAPTAPEVPSKFPSSRGDAGKNRGTSQPKPLASKPLNPQAPKFVQKPVQTVTRRPVAPFGRPDRLNLAEVEDEEEEEELEEADEEDEAINDALHPRPRPLRADTASVAGPPPPQASAPPSAPALGSLLRLGASPAAPRRSAAGPRAAAAAAPPPPPPPPPPQPAPPPLAPQSFSSRIRAAPEPSGFRQPPPVYDTYYAY